MFLSDVSNTAFELPKLCHTIDYLAAHNIDYGQSTILRKPAGLIVLHARICFVLTLSSLGLLESKGFTAASGEILIDPARASLVDMG